MNTKLLEKVLSKTLRRKTIVGLVIATLVLSGIAVAVSAQNEGEPRVGDIVPGAITSTHILDTTIVGGDLATNIAIETTGLSSLDGGIAVDDNFAVSGTTGAITVIAGQGLDTIAAGALKIGDGIATTVDIGTTAAATLNIGAGGDFARAINIGTGTAIDTIQIGGGGTLADDIDIGDALADVDILGASAITAGTDDTLAISAGDKITITNTAGAAADDFTISQAGDFDASLILTSAGTGLDALSLSTTAATGGIKITTGNDFTLNGVADSAYTIGAATVGGTITIGGTAQTGAINIGTGTAADLINIGTAADAADDINIGGKSDTTIDFTGTVSLGNNQVDATELAAAAIPRITNEPADKVDDAFPAVANTYEAVASQTITLTRTSTLIITYSGTVIGAATGTALPAGEEVFVKVTKKTGVEAEADITPVDIKFADGVVNDVQGTIQVFTTTVGTGDTVVKVYAKTPTTALCIGFDNQVLTVIAIPE